MSTEGHKKPTFPKDSSSWPKRPSNRPSKIPYIQGQHPAWNCLGQGTQGAALGKDTAP
jgi:hypothetical protein